MVHVPVKSSAASTETHGGKDNDFFVLTPGRRYIFRSSGPSDHLFLPKTVFNLLPPAAPTTAEGKDWRRFFPKHGSLFTAKTRCATVTHGFSCVRSVSCLLESLTQETQNL